MNSSALISAAMPIATMASATSTSISVNPAGATACHRVLSIALDELAGLDLALLVARDRDAANRLFALDVSSNEVRSPFENIMMCG